MVGRLVSLKLLNSKVTAGFGGARAKWYSIELLPPKATNAPLAQSAEQLTLNQWVPGSSPGGRTKTQFLLTRAGFSSSLE
mgnify:CR=1 FL=1